MAQRPPKGWTALLWRLMPWLRRAGRRVWRAVRQMAEDAREQAHRARYEVGEKVRKRAVERLSNQGRWRRSWLWGKSEFGHVKCDRPGEQGRRYSWVNRPAVQKGGLPWK